MLPVVMVGESAGIDSTVCDGNDDMLRPRRVVPARAGSALDRPAFFFCHPLPRAETLPTRGHAAGEQAWGRSAGAQGAGRGYRVRGASSSDEDSLQGTLRCSARPRAALDTHAAASPAGLTSAGRRRGRLRTRVSGR